MTVLVLAGGADQIALVGELRRREGVERIVLVDWFDNPPAKPYADKHVVASTLDTEAVKRIAVEEGVSLICTACTDQALLTVAQVSEQLALPCYISYRTALNVTNKSYMKRVMMENGIPTSQYAIFDRYDAATLASFKYPLVVKPVDCNSSKGVRRVECDEELRSALADAISYSRTDTAIVEEFKSGREVSADFYVEDGKAMLLCATTSTKIPNRDTFTILQSVYPTIDAGLECRLVEIAQRIADAFELKNTPLLVQSILQDGEFYVLEFSARMGGGSKYKLIEVLSGVNIMSCYVDLILGTKPVVRPSKQVEYAVMNYIYCHPGIVSGFENFETLLSEGVIDEYFYYKSAGMSVDRAETSGDRAAGYLVTASTKEELAHKVTHADSKIVIRGADGCDMMIHNLV